MINPPKVSFIVILCFSASLVSAQDPVFLKRSLDQVPVAKNEISSKTAHYQAFFGEGTISSKIVQCVKRFGYFSIDPEGKSQSVNYNNEEQICYVLNGTGILHYGEQDVPISKNDFYYLHVGIEYFYSNPRERPLNIIIMGYEIPENTTINETQNLLIANADEVPFQVLGQHGPTTQFQLLLGTTESKRDRLAAAYQVNSLFVIEFAEGGTNIPHKHEKEEEIYFLLRGHGE
ncbi:MAG: hypothetical protein KAQ62_14250, partial [Cyclobacteriaceae bacterium]|nr:hypothetical protein [Cyclobacteriaceae bacterium]